MSTPTPNASAVLTPAMFGGRVAAIDPAAFGVEFLVASPAAREPFERHGAVAVVDVCGPLSFAPGCFDTYEAVRKRVALALASDAVAVVVRFDSPGGDVYGSFDTARAMSAEALAANKPLVAYTGAKMLSAAYALACGCNQIYCSDVAEVGSVGVLVQVPDLTGANAAMGVAFALLTSGARKADGNPNLSLSDEARAAIQGRVDRYAGLFFDHVAQARGLDTDAVAALQGSVVCGVDARAAGLVDATISFDALVQQLQGNSPMPMPDDDKSKAAAQASAEDKKDDDKDTYAKARAALKDMAAAGDKKAIAALAALNKEEDAKAEGDELEKKDDEKKDDDAVAKAVASAIAPLAAVVNGITAKVTADAEAKERADLIASRPDLAADLVAVLKAESTPIGMVREMVAKLTRGTGSKPAVLQALDASQAKGTPGAATGGLPAMQQAPEAANFMAKAMGLVKPTPKVTHTPTTSTFSLLGE